MLLSYDSWEGLEQGLQWWSLSEEGWPLLIISWLSHLLFNCRTLSGILLVGWYIFMIFGLFNFTKFFT